MRRASSVTRADFPVPGGPRMTRCCSASSATREARTTSSRSISDAVSSRSSACSLSRDGLIDWRLSVVDIAIILSLIAYSFVFSQLQTPLAVLAHEAQQARAAGYEQLAAAIDQQIDRSGKSTITLRKRGQQPPPHRPWRPPPFPHPPQALSPP